MTRCDSLVKRFTGMNLHKLSEHILARIKTEQGSVMDRPLPTQENVGIFAGIKDLLDDEPLLEALGNPRRHGLLQSSSEHSSTLKRTSYSCVPGGQ